MHQHHNHIIQIELMTLKNDYASKQSWVGPEGGGEQNASKQSWVGPEGGEEQNFRE